MALFVEDNVCGVFTERHLSLTSRAMMVEIENHECSPPNRATGAENVPFYLVSKASMFLDWASLLFSWETGAAAGLAEAGGDLTEAGRGGGGGRSGASGRALPAPAALRPMVPQLL